MIEIGDWVQTAVEVHELGLGGEPIGLISKKNGVGHVMAEGRWGDDLFYTVTFERTGMTSDCAPEDLIRLCDYRGVVDT